MSKYIIDTETWSNLFEAKKVGIYGIGIDLLTNEKTVWSRMFHLDELEELNSDYINEHSRELQDEAYQKGFEDGKKSTEKGCEGCKYELYGDTEDPCLHCCKNYKDKYEPAPHSERIEVGDEVESPRGKAVVTAVKDDFVHYFYSDGDCRFTEQENLKKTGKHYDIQSILEAMRE